MSIIGVGIDVAEIDRFLAALERTPGLAHRLFLDQELHLPNGERRGIASLAARFAAKEAVAKALGAPVSMPGRTRRSTSRTAKPAAAAGDGDGGGARGRTGRPFVACVAEP